MTMEERLIGTISRGVRAPIIREGDDLAKIVVDSVIDAAASSRYGFEIQDKDIVAVTEAVVARAQGNYASIDNIAADVKEKFGDETVGVIFPILSRNRFAICLKGIARGVKKDGILSVKRENTVGNPLIDEDELDAKGVNPWADVLSEEKYRELFGYNKHTFTGVDYIEYYKDVIKEQGAEVEVVLANDCRTILKYTDNVICCDIHTRARSKRRLLAAGAKKVCCLDDIMTASIDGSGYNENYGLLGSNKATEETVKLFPRDCQPFVDRVHQMMMERTGKHVEVMIYGDGAFKDPVGKIWELADPVVGAGYTDGLNGLPNELKLKYLADNDFADLNGDALADAIKNAIKAKEANLKGQMASEGTTPRRLTDLIGSLCDLTSGSGDKGTPIVLVQNYFNNYAN